MYTPRRSLTASKITKRTVFSPFNYFNSNFYQPTGILEINFQEQFRNNDLTTTSPKSVTFKDVGNIKSVASSRGCSKELGGGPPGKEKQSSEPAHVHPFSAPLAAKFHGLKAESLKFVRENHPNQLPSPTVSFRLGKKTLHSSHPIVLSTAQGRSIMSYNALQIW